MMRSMKGWVVLHTHILRTHYSLAVSNNTQLDNKHTKTFNVFNSTNSIGQRVPYIDRSIISLLCVV